jgi:hypothetical protein
VKEPLAVPENFTQTWSIDFMSDVLSNGTKFRSFNVTQMISTARCSLLKPIIRCGAAG